MHGKKDINWGTPKKLQSELSRQHRNHNRNKKKKKNYCVIHKGAHVFDIKEIEYFFNKPWAYQWRCKCGKKGKKEYIDPPEWLKNQISQKKLLTCSKCGKNLIHTVDPITKKKSKYLYYCPCSPDKLISVG